MNTQPSRDEDHQENGNRDHENLNAQEHYDHTPNHDNLYNNDLNNDTLYPDHLAELYPLMFSKLTGEITIGEDQRLSKLLESPEAFAIWESFQKTYNDPETMSRAQSLISKDDSAETARLLVTERQRRKKNSLLTGVVMMVLGAIAAFLFNPYNKTAKTITPNDNVLSMTISDAVGGSTYLLTAGLNQLDACGVALYDTAAQFIKIKPSSAFDKKRYTLNVPAGMQCTITLPDSSHVLVNAESKLTFPAVFNGANRAVSLNGEAVFYVTSHASRPFFVKLKKSSVEVLGTVFSVNTYDSTDKITLKEGLVAVRVPGATTQHLLPGQTAFAGDKRIEVSPNPTVPVTWDEDGLYELHDLSLRQLAPVLKRRFNVRVVFEPGYIEDTYTGLIHPEEPLSSFVETLRKVCTNSRFELRNNILYIKK